MKKILTFLAIGLVAADKLDRTYLPPQGAHLSGGNLGNHDAPLELPHYSHYGPETNYEGSLINQKKNRGPVNFGGKLHNNPASYYHETVPTTTTSYAFSQTTTFPPGENVETTILPINPVTGISINLIPANNLYGSTEGQQNNQNLLSYPQSQVEVASNYGNNRQSLFSPSITKAIDLRPFHAQEGNQPSNQYLGQDILASGNTIPIFGSATSMPTQNQIQIKYPDEQHYVTQQKDTGYQDLNQYPIQNILRPGENIKFPGDDQKLQSYPGDRKDAEQQRFIPSTAFPQGTPVNLQSDGSQYSANNDGSQGRLAHETYFGHPTNVQNLDQPQPIQGNPQNQEKIGIGEIPTQHHLTGNQNLGVSGPGSSSNAELPFSTTPSSYFDGALSPTTSHSNLSSSFAPSYSSSGSTSPNYHPEGSQAAVDRNAVILNYKNDLTPNGYAYSFDTSNGIHADESGIVDNGTKAQGSYSYTGDDGKVYSVIYTADENGFQPRGDHLPTSPPIPEAIKRVIEQAARDEAAGIVDDGSYDDAKYGDKTYQGSINRSQFNGPRDSEIKPVAGIYDIEDDEGFENQLHDKLPITETRAKPSEEIPSSSPLSKFQDLSGENRRVLVTNKDGNIPFGDLEEGGKEISGVDGTNRPNTFKVKQQEPRMQTTPGGDNMSSLDGDLQSAFRRPASTGTKDLIYPGSKHNYYDTADYSEPKRNKFRGSADQKINSGIPKSLGHDKVTDRKYNSVTDSQFIGDGKQIASQGPQGKEYSQNQDGRPYVQTNRQESIGTPVGYHYKSPKTEFNQNKFPTRFSPQEASRTEIPEKNKNKYDEGLTRRPFITPNVNRQNGGDRQSTTRKPFTTVGVTSPKAYSYTEYDDGDDYTTDGDTDDDRISSTESPTEKIYSYTRPYTVSQTTSKPKYTPAGQGTHDMGKGNVSPGQNMNRLVSTMPTLGYTIGSTPIPTQGSRFGSTTVSQRPMKNLQRIPSATVSDHQSAIGRPVTSLAPSKSRTSEYKYQTTGSPSVYRPKVYPATGIDLASSYSPNYPLASPENNYSTLRNSPDRSYSSTTEITPISGYQQGSGSITPSTIPVLSRQSSAEDFQSGYHYGPPKSKFIETAYPSSERPLDGFFNPFETLNVSPTLSPNTYQTTYPQGRGSHSSTTPAPFSRKPEAFLSSHPGGNPPAAGERQSNVANPGSSGALSPQTQSSYGSAIPNYSTLVFPPTVATTTYLVPSEISITPTDDYSTIYGPGFQSTKDVRGPVVDGFGRPITHELGGTFTGYPLLTQDSKRPIHQEYGISQNPRKPIIEQSTGSNSFLPENKQEVNLGHDFEHSTTYPGSYDQPRVTVEDFSGPQQPQSYDPQTGYHYK